MSAEVVGAAVSITCAAVAAARLRGRALPTGWKYGRHGRHATLLVEDAYGEARRYEIAHWSVAGARLRGRCLVSGRVRTFTIDRILVFRPC